MRPRRQDFDSILSVKAVGPRQVCLATGQAGTQPQGRGREAQGGGGEMVGVELVWWSREAQDGGGFYHFQ